MIICGVQLRLECDPRAVGEVLNVEPRVIERRFVAISRTKRPNAMKKTRRLPEKRIGN